MLPQRAGSQRMCVRVRLCAVRGCAAAFVCFNTCGTLAIEICNMCPKTGFFDRTDGLGFGFRPALLGSVASIIIGRLDGLAASTATTVREERHRSSLVNGERCSVRLTEPAADWWPAAVAHTPTGPPSRPRPVPRNPFKFAQEAR